MQLALLCATFAIMVIGSQAGSDSESCSMVNGKWHCVRNSDPNGNAAYSGSYAQSGGRGGSHSHNSAATGFAPGGFDPFSYVFGPGGSPFGGGGGAYSGARAGGWGRKKK